MFTIVKIMSSRMTWIFAALAAITAIFVGVYWKGHDDGKSGVAANIARQNEKIINRSDDARARVDRCFHDGGVWNIATGRCDGGL